MFLLYNCLLFVRLCISASALTKGAGFRGKNIVSCGLQLNVTQWPNNRFCYCAFVFLDCVPIFFLSLAHSVGAKRQRLFFFLQHTFLPACAVEATTAVIRGQPPPYKAEPPHKIQQQTKICIRAEWEKS